MALSSDVASKTPILATQYNSLRADTLNALSGHVHSGAADGGAPIPHANLASVTADQHHAGFVGLKDDASATVSPDASDLITVLGGNGIATTAATNAISLAVELATNSGLNFAGGALYAHSLRASNHSAWALQSDTAGNVTVPVGSLALTLGDFVLSAGTAGTDHYASQTTGWRVSYAGSADFRYLFTDELHAKAFITDLEQALAGGQIIAKSVAVLAQDFALPAAGATGTITLEDLPSAPDMAVFESGDIVCLRQFSRAAGALSIGYAWGTVTDYADGAGGVQTWTFTRSTGADAGTATGTIAAKGLVLDFGTTGNGYYEVNAIDGAYAENSPYAQVVTWATHPHTGKSIRVRLGNLEGLTTGWGYGLFAGNGKTTADAYIRAGSEGVSIYNAPLRLYDGANLAIRLEPGTAPYLGIGATAPSAYATGAGVWMGDDAGTYKFRVGNPSGTNPLLSYDGAALALRGASLALYNAGAQTVAIGADGDAFFGSNIAAAATTSLAIFSNAQTYNSEALGAGDILFGDNSAAKANILWDRSAGTLLFRGGTTTQAYIDTTGALVAGDGAVTINATDGIRIADGKDSKNQLKFVSATDSSSVSQTGGRMELQSSVAIRLYPTISGQYIAHTSYDDGTIYLDGTAQVAYSAYVHLGLNVGNTTGAPEGNIRATGQVVGSLNGGSGTRAVAAFLHSHSDVGSAASPVEHYVLAQAYSGSGQQGPILAAVNQLQNDYSQYWRLYCRAGDGTLGLVAQVEYGWLKVYGQGMFMSSTTEGHIYLGDPNTDGCWKLVATGGACYLQERVGGVWTTKGSWS
jgi:hypothetical protein